MRKVRVEFTLEVPSWVHPNYATSSSLQGRLEKELGGVSEVEVTRI